MQDVAAEAGLSVGAAYRYFDSKDALFGAALDRMGEQIAAAATESDQTEEAFEALLEVMLSRPAFVRIGTSLLLEGRNVSHVMSKHPAALAIAAQARERGDPDPETVAGAVLMVGLGAAVYGVTTNRALGRADDDDRLGRAVGSMVAAWIASRGGRDGAW